MLKRLLMRSPRATLKPTLLPMSRATMLSPKRSFCRHSSLVAHSSQSKWQGITAITGEEVQRAIDEHKRIKLVASLRLLPENNSIEGSLEARVQPLALPLNDPLARVDGVLNALTIQTDTLSEVTIIGPGAGRLQTGQGLLADIIACAVASSRGLQLHS